MTCAERFNLIAQYGQTLIQGGVLAATIFFYSKLVSNDNRREERAEKEYLERKVDEIETYAKNSFRKCGTTIGALQLVGKNLRQRYSNGVPMILTTYDELRNEESEASFPLTLKFATAMDNYDREGKWLEFYKIVFEP